MSNSILVSKVIFTPDLKPGDVVQVDTNAEQYFGLIVENKEDMITLAIVKESMDENGKALFSIGTIEVHANEVENGEIHIQQFYSEAKLSKLYHMYKEVSTLLSDAESMNAEASGIGSQEDIEVRHKARLNSFLKIIKE